MFIEMRLVWLWVMLVLVSECYGCLEKERIALLQIKASIHNPNRNTVETWEEAWKGEATTDCCGWEGVKCNTKTGRVIQLSLIVEHIIYWALEDRCLNVSMFLPFEELESLDLSNNGLQGCLENNEGFEKLARLSNLQLLDLTGNSFNNSILSTLGGLTSLKSLNLGGNNLEGTINIDDLKHLNNLEELDFSYNRLDGFTTHSDFERLSVLSKLKVLTLAGNLFSHSIISSPNAFPSLKTLDLSSNAINGSIMEEFRNMSNLEELDLGRNSLEDIKGLERLSMLSNLKVLKLDNNIFSNSILSSLSGLSSLKTLHLSNSNLCGSIDIGEATMDVPSDYIPYLKKAFDGLETGLAGFLQASAPDWIIYDFAFHWLPPIATKLGISRAFFLIINAWFAAFFGPASALIDSSGATNNASGVSDLYRFGSAVLGCDVYAIRHCREFEPQWLTLLQDLQPKQQW